MKYIPDQKTCQVKSMFLQFDNTRAKKRGGLVRPPRYKHVTAEQVSAAAAVELAVMPVLRRRYSLR
jgi:hypothetical protein